MKRVCVIGAGAAGLMAAVTAAGCGADVTVFERNEKAGRKLYITGKGRCNVCNNCSGSEFLKNVVTNPKFMYSAINAFPPSALMEFLTGAGVPLKTERGNRVFPESDKSSDIIRAFTAALQKHKVNVRYSTRVTAVKTALAGLSVEYLSGGKANTEDFDKVIIATGGISYPATGSTGDGHRLAAALGHKITPLRPSLVPLVLKEDVRALEGLSLKNAGFTVLNGQSKICSDFGELLFTSEGVSGPVVLSASSLINKTDLSGVCISIDLKTALDIKQLDARILRDFNAAINKQFKNALDGLLPKSLIPYIIGLSGIDPNKEVNVITREERGKLAALLKDLRFQVKRLGAVEEGIVTCGGVDVSGINPRSMESKNVPGLYFAGEVIDVDAFTGGFNLQAAFSTGFVAGRHGSA